MAAGVITLAISKKKGKINYFYFASEKLKHLKQVI